MKKCPFCGEKLDDSARFCLYCMKPLEEKEKIVNLPDKRKKHIILVILSALAVAVLVALLFICLRSCGDNTGNTKGNQRENIGSQKSSATPIFTDYSVFTDVPTTTFKPTNENISATDFLQKSPSVTFVQSNTNVPTNTSIPGVSSTATPFLETTYKPTATKIPFSSATTGGTSTPTATVTFTPKTTIAPTPATEIMEEVTWYYYDTTGSSSEGFLIDMYGDGNFENTITICGFKNITSNGIYKIPDMIDGKTVVALNMSAGKSQGYTFSSADVIDTVKKVYLPPRLMVVIGESAFTKCPNITDLYVASEKLHIASNYFPYYYNYTAATKNGFTLHASEDCIALYIDRKTTFKSVVGSGSYYNGKFKKWDKSEQY